MVETKSTEAARPHEGVLSLFDSFERGGHGSTPSWLQALNKGGIAHFAELGFPTTNHEEWRFTNVSSIAKASWQLPSNQVRASEKEVSRALFPGVKGRRLVFVDGCFSKELSSKEVSSPNSLRVMSLYDGVRSTYPL